MQAKALEESGRVAADGARSSREGLQTVVLPRIGKPPLRFQGTPLWRNDSENSFGTDLSILLWQRQGKHFAASATVVCDDDVAQDATLAGSIDEASRWLEAHCDALAERREKAPRKGRLNVDDHIRFLLSRYQTRSLERAFLRLAGEALDEWDLLDNWSGENDGIRR